MELIHKYLALSPDSPTGLVWKEKPPRSKVIIGTPALTSDVAGYWGGVLGGRRLLAHRAVFALHYGYMPDRVDHLDGNPRNNAATNLREVSASENQHNRVSKGYYFCNTTKQYIAQICVGGRKRTLGTFSNPDAARVAYLVAKVTAHPTAPARCF